MILIKTSKGDIKVQLHSEEVPKTVENFLHYVKEGFYNDTIFHRVIDGFMIQGGGFTQEMEQKKVSAPIENEASRAKPNKRGTLAMARTMDPHSATAQFFINAANNDFLNFTQPNPQGFGYCVFGEVTEGMDVIDAIIKVKTGTNRGHGDVPVEPVVVLEVTEVE